MPLGRDRGALKTEGGIRRHMANLLATREDAGSGKRYRVVDTRGCSWFLIGVPLLNLVCAALQLVLARLSSASIVVHVNITGRRSTARKIVLITVARARALRYSRVHDYNYACDYLARGWLMGTLIPSVFRGAERVLVLGVESRRVLPAPDESISGLARPNRSCRLVRTLKHPSALSHDEGVAMSMLEGLSRGLTVVATPVDFHTEAIEREVSGTLVSPGDVNAVAGGLLRD
jgi:hypothetical protein